MLWAKNNITPPNQFYVKSLTIRITQEHLMRPLEIVIPILLAVFLLWPHPHSMVIRLVPVATLIVMLAHFTLEGYRWQMIPLYASTLF
mgnify:CR=1 FL=1